LIIIDFINNIKAFFSSETQFPEPVQVQPSFRIAFKKKSRWRETGWPVKIASIRPGFVQVEKRRIIIDKITILRDNLRHEKSRF
jgi:hypothetical protein